MLKRLTADLTHNAKLLGALPVGDGCLKTLDCFKHLIVSQENDNQHSSGYSAFRVTTKDVDHRSLSFRWFDWTGEFSNDISNDPYNIAIENNLIDLPQNSIVSKAYNDTYNKLINDYGITTLCKGIDLSCDYGLEKIWLFFFMEPKPLQLLTKDKINSMPSVVNNHLCNYFDKYNINNVQCLGFDFRNQTMNIYRMLPLFVPENNNILNKMINDPVLNFDQCSLYDELNLSNVAGLGFTIKWNENNPLKEEEEKEERQEVAQRLCVYYFGNENEIVPNDYYNIWSKNVSNEVSLYDKYNNQCISGITVGRNISNYYGKFEWEYKQGFLRDFNFAKQQFYQSISTLK